MSHFDQDAIKLSILLSHAIKNGRKCQYATYGNGQDSNLPT